jgi:serine/threonine protein kinase
LAKASLSPVEIARLLIPIAHALDFAHRKGFIHRDLKPANIMIPEAGEAILVDFGLALQEHEQDFNKIEAFGTLRYMSPEQTRGKFFSARTDIWSFGVILYEAILKQPPFGPCDTKVALFEQICSRPILSLRTDVPPELEQIWLNCLEKDAQHRYASAAALAADLEAFVKSSGSDNPTIPESPEPEPVPVDPLTAQYRDLGSEAFFANVAAQWESDQVDDNHRLGVLRLIRETKDPQGTLVVCLGILRGGESAERASKYVERAASALRGIGWKAWTDFTRARCQKGDAEAVDLILRAMGRSEANPDLIEFLSQMIAFRLTPSHRHDAAQLLSRFRLTNHHHSVRQLFIEMQNPYSIDEFLGEGNLTLAHRCTHQDNPESFVVRILKDEFVDKISVRQRFTDLSHAMTKVRNESNVRVFEMTSLPGKRIYYSVREYVHGELLKKVFSADYGKKLSFRSRIKLLRQIASALADIHRTFFADGRGHGALNPGNIFFPTDRPVVLGDPAIVNPLTLMDSPRRHYDVLYLAPEADGDFPFPSWDIYAFGCIAFELFVGSPPFLGDSVNAVIAKHVTEAPKRLSDFGIQAGDELQTLISRCLQKNPNDRYANVHEILDDLDDALATVIHEEKRGKSSMPVSLSGSDPKTAPPPMSDEPQEPTDYGTMNWIAEKVEQEAAGPKVNFDQTFVPTQILPPATPAFPETTKSGQANNEPARNPFGHFRTDEWQFKDIDVSRIGEWSQLRGFLTEKGIVTELEWDDAQEAMSQSGDDSIAKRLARTPSKRFSGETVLSEYQLSLIESGRIDELTYKDWIVLDQLGEGGMGSVFRVRHSKVPRIRVLKMIHERLFEQCEDPRERQAVLARFVREIKNTVGLDPEHVPNIFDAGEAHGKPFYVMEYIDGFDLSTLIKRTRLAGKVQPLRDVLDLFIRIAGVVANFHLRNIVHRDLKPGNIMINESGSVLKILDFGIAKQLSSEESKNEDASMMETTQAGQMLGSLHYMSTEQLAGDIGAIGFHTDVYLLAATMFHVLTLELPFRGKSKFEVIQSHAKDQRPRPSQFRSDIPPDLDAFFAKALAVKTENRYRNMDEFKSALMAILGDFEKDLEKQASQRVWRRRLIGAGIVGGILSGLALLAYSIFAQF